MGILNWLSKMLLGVESPKSDNVINYEDGVTIIYTKDGEIILKNTIHNIEVMIMNKDGILVHINEEDIDFNRVDLLENPENAHRLSTRYGFSFGRFEDGIAELCWTLYPDGRYFEDEDGFGGENCNETTIYSYIDTLGKIIIPFRDMTYEEKKDFKAIAKYKVRLNNSNEHSNG